MALQIVSGLLLRVRWVRAHSPAGVVPKLCLAFLSGTDPVDHLLIDRAPRLLLFGHLAVGRPAKGVRGVWVDSQPALDVLCQHCRFMLAKHIGAWQQRNVTSIPATGRLCVCRMLKAAVPYVAHQLVRIKLNDAMPHGIVWGVQDVGISDGRTGRANLGEATV